MTGRLNSRRQQRGFTIVELMIATAVLSVIILLVTAMMIRIGTLFDKGINQSRVQDAVRSIADDLSQSLEYSNGQVTVAVGGVRWADGADGVVCAGNLRYSFWLNRNLGTGNEDNGTAKIPHVLLRDTVPPGGCTSTPPTAGTELMPPNSRLTAFCVGTYNSAAHSCSSTSSSPWTITLEVVYGDHDLSNSSTTSPLQNNSVLCNGHSGDQFCATAALQTTVVQRTFE